MKVLPHFQCKNYWNRRHNKVNHLNNFWLCVYLSVDKPIMMSLCHMWNNHCYRSIKPQSWFHRLERSMGKTLPDQLGFNSLALWMLPYIHTWSVNGSLINEAQKTPSQWEEKHTHMENAFKCLKRGLCHLRCCCFRDETCWLTCCGVAEQPAGWSLLKIPLRNQSSYGENGGVSPQGEWVTRLQALWCRLARLWEWSLWMEKPGHLGRHKRGLFSHTADN